MPFELIRHSDHYNKHHKLCRLLDSVDNAPQLPTGYLEMMVLCLSLPLCFAAMNPRLEKLKSGH